MLIFNTYTLDLLVIYTLQTAYLVGLFKLRHTCMLIMVISVMHSFLLCASNFSGILNQRERKVLLMVTLILVKTNSVHSLFVTQEHYAIGNGQMRTKQREYIA